MRFTIIIVLILFFYYCDAKLATSSIVLKRERKKITSRTSKFLSRKDGGQGNAPNLQRRAAKASGVF